MTGVTIRLPTAAPEAYLAWVTWWREVEQLLGSDLATAPGDDDGLAPDRGARSIVLQHVRSLEEQARRASEEGKQTISPELSAEPTEWDRGGNGSRPSRCGSSRNRWSPRTWSPCGNEPCR